MKKVLLVITVLAAVWVPGASAAGQAVTPDPWWADAAAQPDPFKLMGGRAAPDPFKLYGGRAAPSPYKLLGGRAAPNPFKILRGQST